jgi:hypothetical protein
MASERDAACDRSRPHREHRHEVVHSTSASCNLRHRTISGRFVSAHSGALFRTVTSTTWHGTDVVITFENRCRDGRFA